MININCPCGSDLEYSSCCGQYIEHQQFAPTPESLMRSRYTAFVLNKIDYIAQTMRGPAAQNFNRLDTATWLENIKWLGLTVLKHRLKNDNVGFVCFEARYSSQGILHSMREKSEFHKENGQWFYYSGKPLNPNTKL